MGKVLVVVDYQKDFVDGALGFPGAQALAGGIAALVEARRSDGVPVVFTLDTHGKEYPQTREGRHLPVAHCTRETPAWRLYGPLERYMEEKPDGIFFVEKDNFGTLDFEFLRKFDPTEIELCGVVTNICVISNAVTLQTLFPQAELTVYADLCGGGDETLHEKALDVMQGLQMQVVREYVPGPDDAGSDDEDTDLEEGL